MASTIRRSTRLMAKQAEAEAKAVNPVANFIETVTQMPNKYGIVRVTKEFMDAYKIDVNALTLEHLKHLNPELMTHCAVLEYIVQCMVTPNTPAMKEYLTNHVNPQRFYLIGVTSVTVGGKTHYRRFTGYNA